MIKAALLSLMVMGSISASGASSTKHFNLNITDISGAKVKTFGIFDGKAISCTPNSGVFNADAHHTGIISCVDTYYSSNDSVQIVLDDRYCSRVKLSALHENGINSCVVVSSARYFGKILITCNGDSYESC